MGHTTPRPTPGIFCPLLSHSGYISDVSPAVQEKPATVDGTKDGGQVRKRTVPLRGVPSRLPVWSNGPGLSLMAIPKLITERGKEAPMIDLIQS